MGSNNVVLQLCSRNRRHNNGVLFKMHFMLTLVERARILLNRLPTYLCVHILKKDLCKFGTGCMTQLLKYWFVLLITTTVQDLGSV